MIRLWLRHPTTRTVLTCKCQWIKWKNNPHLSFSIKIQFIHIQKLLIGMYKTYWTCTEEQTWYIYSLDSLLKSTFSKETFMFKHGSYSSGHWVNQGLTVFRCNLCAPSILERLLQVNKRGSMNSPSFFLRRTQLFSIGFRSGEFPGHSTKKENSWP